MFRWRPPDEPSPAGKRALDLSQFNVAGSLLLSGGMIAVLTAVQLGAGPQSAGTGVALGLAGRLTCILPLAPTSCCCSWVAQPGRLSWRPVLTRRLA